MARFYSVPRVNPLCFEVLQETRGDLLIDAGCVS
jgi:hypothetical protein